MKTIIRRIASVALIITILTTSVFALDKLPESSSDVPLRTVGISHVSYIFDINSYGQATCCYYITLVPNYTADVTMTLQQAPYGSERWKDVKEWSASGSYPEIAIEKSRAVNSGYDYQLEIEVDIYNSSGRLVDSTTDYSDIVSY